jgi:hypothetical protein
MFYLLWFYSGVLCAVFLCLLLCVPYVKCPAVLYYRVIAASLESDCRGFMLGVCRGCCLRKWWECLCGSGISVGGGDYLLGCCGMCVFYN